MARENRSDRLCNRLDQRRLAKSLLASTAMLVVAGVSFTLIDRLIVSGVTGWAIGFVFAKLIAEVLVACIPLVMAQVAREGA